MALVMAQPSFLAASLYVAVGGSIGAWLRFLSGHAAVALLGPVKAGAFPWSTLFCNVAGSVAMGLVMGWLARHAAATGASAEGLRLFLAVGVLGGFTTFSAFSMEIVLLAQRGQTGLAALYAALSLAAGIAGLLLGLALMRQPA